jgi:rfaE bifunctional protein kinase chain/domain
MLDRYWSGDVSRISPEAPVPIVGFRNEENRPGGAANVALNAKVFGVQSTLLGLIGQDEPGRALQALLEQCGIGAGLIADSTLETTVKLRIVGLSQQMLRVDFEKSPGAAGLQLLATSFQEELPRNDVVVFSDYGKGALCEVSELISAARNANKIVLVDPKGIDYTKYRGANVLTPNRAELAAVVGPWSNEDDLIRRTLALREALNVNSILLTRSEEGMTLFEAGRVVSVPAAVREVRDVTGAGDTVIAILAALLGCNIDTAEAVTIANKAAGLAVGKFGTAAISYEALFQ